MVRAKNAYGAGDSVIYEYEDGKRERWSGGDRSWRNQNPGNVRSNSIHWENQIGKAGGFCIFNNPDAGKRVTGIIIGNRKREGKTLMQAMESYASRNENNTDAYVAFLVKYVNKDIPEAQKERWISKDTRLNTQPQEIIDKIVQGIFVYEGKLVGSITPLENKKYGMYIWSTSHDEKVRQSHAELDGKTFDFSHPSAVGNPGDDFNCRCIAIATLKQILGDK